jgi:hypothetical protein
MAPRKPKHGGRREGAGRPAGGGEHGDLLRVRASEELLDRLRERAEREGVTVAAIVRRALERELAE